MMYCPSCTGQMNMCKGIVVTFSVGLDYTDFGIIAYCTNCALVSEVNPDRGVLVDLSLSLSVVFDRQQPRLTIEDYPVLRGRNDS